MFGYDEFAGNSTYEEMRGRFNDLGIECWGKYEHCFDELTSCVALADNMDLVS